MRIMLISPPCTQDKKAMKRCLFPLGLGYLASVLEKEGHKVGVVDCLVEGYDKELDLGNGDIRIGISFDELFERIKAFVPDIVGVSCIMSRQAANAHKVCEVAKRVNHNITTIMGGTHVSALPEQVIKDANVALALVGDAEVTLPKIIRERQTKKVIFCEPVDIRSLPWPARHLFPMEKYIEINMPTSVYSPHNRVTQIETTRGCPFSCVFCATTRFKGKYQMRDVLDVLKEIRFLKEKYNIEEIDIIDSNFIVNKKRTIELLKGIKQIDIAWSNGGGIWIGGLNKELLDVMKSSGCYQLSLAVESSTSRVLKEVINKPTKIEMVEPIVKYCDEIGIDLHAFFIVGFPEQTIDEINADFEFAKKMNFTSVSFNIISPLPGSKIYDKYIGDNIDFNQIDLRKASIMHPQIRQSDLETLVDNFNRKFNRSLIYRKPIVFIRKYIMTLLRKPSFRIMRRMFSRQ